MKQRNIFKMLLLMFVTLGIYNVYWAKVTRDEMVAKGAKIPSFWLLFAPLLILIATLAVALVGRGVFAAPSLGQQFGNSTMVAAQDFYPDASTSDTPVDDSVNTTNDGLSADTDTNYSNDYTALDSGLEDDPLSDEKSSPARLGMNLVAVVLGLVGVISGMVIPLYWYYKYCHGVEMVTHGRTSSGTAYLLFIVLSIFMVGFVWPLIIQDSFNKVNAAGADPYNPHQQPQPPTSYTHY